MAKLALFLALALVGCGGTPFTVGVTDEGDGGPPAATGGAPAVGSGGKVGLSTGGSSAGGTPDTGGIPSSGGVVGSGGATGSTGGEEADAGHASGGTAVGGAPVADACVPVTHSNGAGQTWQDCVPLGTHNSAQALKACNAYVVAHGTGTVCVGGDVNAQQAVTSSEYKITIWVWRGSMGSIAGEVCQRLGAGVCTVIGTWD